MGFDQSLQPQIEEHWKQQQKFTIPSLDRQSQEGESSPKIWEVNSSNSFKSPNESSQETTTVEKIVSIKDNSQEAEGMELEVEEMDQENPDLNKLSL